MHFVRNASGVVPDKPSRIGDATIAARQNYVAEQLCLLYVGITRAKKELIIMWNTGKRNLPAVPFIELRT